MYEELASDGSTRMVGTLEDIQNQYKLKQRSRDTSNSKVDDEFISDMWSVMDRAGNLLISKHHDYGPLNIARSPGGPINGLRVRMWDKIARINHLVDNNSAPQNESLRILLLIYLTIQLLQLWY
jgi:hypothetical protein